MMKAYISQGKRRNNMIRRKENLRNMYVETLHVAGIEPALKGMRNPMNSWDRSDSMEILGHYEIGPEDLRLAKKLTKAGPEHCKFLRQIRVWADVNMPRYWWSEADTYGFGSKNSCSTMHKLMETDLKLDDFEHLPEERGYIINFIDYFKILKREFHEAESQKKKNRVLKRSKSILPDGFIQLRTWETSYQQIYNIYKQRKHHKLTDEWGLFCRWAETLPYFKQICLD
jgi:hypothetical protein